MSCNGKDPQLQMNRSINCDISFPSLDSEDIDISKLEPQLKLLPSLFELKDNDYY